jgi:AbrB family looped-hinge helix DNA binding protein
MNVAFGPGCVDTHDVRFEAKVGERGEIVIPEDVRERLQLKPDTTVAVDVAAAIPHLTDREPNWENLEDLVARIRFPMQDALLADGYASVDDYIDDIRGR